MNMMHDFTSVMSLRDEAMNESGLRSARLDADRAAWSFSLMREAQARGDAPALPMEEGCPHREWSAGRPDRGPDLPAFAQGARFPEDEAGPRCKLSGEICDPHPCHCPLWKPSELLCPTCLEFAKRRHPNSLFHESRLLARGGTDGALRGPALALSFRFYCPDCNEEYADLPALFQAAMGRLRDALDDCEFSAGSIAELREREEAARARLERIQEAFR